MAKFKFKVVQIAEANLEEVAGAAGGIENAEFAEAAVEALDFDGGFLRFAHAVESDGGGFGGVPFSS